MCFSVSLLGQNVYSDYWDGVVYFKIKDRIDIIIPEYDNNTESKTNVYEEFPEIIRIIEKYNVTELSRPFKTRCPKIQKTYRLYFNNHELTDALLREFTDLDYIEYAEKSPIYMIQIMPNDEFVGEQYYLSNIQAYDAWEIAESNYLTTVAIVDDAVKIDHPDLEANIWVNPNEILNGEDTDENGFIDDIHGWDVADDNNYPGPPDEPPAIWGEFAFFHGTHCAGIAGAVTNNEIGIAGVSNNNIQIIGVKAVSNTSWIPIAIEKPVEGVDYAVAANADVISMSFGGAQEGFATLENIINAGHENGIIFVAAAGNSGDETVMYPAGFENVIAVGGSTENDELWEHSQRGEFIDILAPAENIYSTLAWSEPYGPQDGTSMACPLVAGAIALLKSHKPDASKADIINCLLYGCDNVDDINPSYIGKMGAGRMNVYKSILCLDDVVRSEINNNKEKIRIFPNPAKNFVNINFENAKKREISVKNLTGQNIYNFNTYKQNNIIDIKNFKAGFYIITIYDGNNIVSEKILIQ